MQTLDVQVQKPVQSHAAPGAAGVLNGKKLAPDGKTGAETARNGSSFLAMIEKMIAGTMDGKADRNLLSGHITTGRGAGDATTIPGDGNTLIKQGIGKNSKNVSTQKSKTDADRLSVRTDRKKAPAAGTSHHPETAKEGIPQDGSPVGRPDTALLRKQGETADALKTEAGNANSSLPVKKNGRGGGSASSIDASLAVAGMQPTLTVFRLDHAKTEKAQNADSLEVKSGKPGAKEKKALISVRDERSANAAAFGAEHPLEKSVHVNNDGTADMSIGFRNATSGASNLTDNAPTAVIHTDADKGQSFASMLSQELRSNAADFVKTGHIILRDNNSGLIRLTLHPESLGNVNISLELSDKKITGKIHVSSQEAYDAFNENLDGLSRAFVQGGFESAGFDLSWSSPDGSGSGRKDEAGTVSSPFYASSIPDVMSAKDTADTQMSGSRRAGLSAVDIFA